LQLAVIVAMISVGMVQMAIDQIIDVIAMWNFLMPAVRAMHVLFVMAAAIMVGGTCRRILGRDREDMLDDRAVGVGVVKMAVVQVIDVPLMVNRGMAATGAVPMIMMAVYFSVMRHNDFLSLKNVNETTTSSTSRPS
jgi:hypothetical protein